MNLDLLALEEAKEKDIEAIWRSVEGVAVRSTSDFDRDDAPG